MIVSKSERLILRTFEEDDIDDVMEFWGNPEVMKYCPGSIFKREIILKALQKYADLQKEREHSVYAVELKETGVVIGGCGFNPTENLDVIELIYHFSEANWGKGYAAEAGNAALSYIGENRKFRRVIASVLPENIASEKILKKLGFGFIEMKWFEDSKCFEPYYEYELY